MTNNIIHCQDLTHRYRRAQESITVFEGLELSISSGEFVAIMGPSGSGKSTLLNLLGGLEQPTEGVIEIQGLDIARLGGKALANWRASSIGFVFQFYNLLPMLNAQSNVEVPLLLTQLSRKERRRRVDAALMLVGLIDRAGHRPSELSGGQQQRVAIARAIVSDPQILICDEPTGDLDRKTADETLSLLKSLNEDLGKTIVMVTHDARAASFASTVLNMDKGLLEAAA
jgi:putative ABC transport system ATP-binding protein